MRAIGRLRDPVKTIKSEKITGFELIRFGLPKRAADDVGLRKLCVVHAADRRDEAEH
jgi:hypothetical protein